MNDGAIRGLYRGFTPNVVGNSVGWAAFFLWYGKAQDALQLYYGSKASLSYYDHFFASGAAGKPLWPSRFFEAHILIHLSQAS